MKLKRKESTCKKCGGHGFYYYRLGRRIKERLNKSCWPCIVSPGLKNLMMMMYEKPSSSLISVLGGMK